jgi:LmbE family N-acetylglucosaminyl deacetylase
MEPEQDRGRRLLCFGAHPDDCEIKSAGLAALWTRAGGQARFVALTDGSAGHTLAR